jgi:hypothetical protein
MVQTPLRLKDHNFLIVQREEEERNHKARLEIAAEQDDTIRHRIVDSGDDTSTIEVVSIVKAAIPSSHALPLCYTSLIPKAPLTIMVLVRVFTSISTSRLRF